MPSQGTSTFDLFALRFYFTADVAMKFPAGATANLIRGQFGKHLRRRGADPDAAIFEPEPRSRGPSGMLDPPRKWVLRVRHLEGARVRSGEEFHIGVNLFETKRSQIVAIGKAMDEVGRETFHAVPVRVEHELLRLPLAAGPGAARLRVRFLTPTELKGSRYPEFGVLFARIRDRISNLRQLYGRGPLSIDFTAIGKRAAMIKTTRCDLEWVEAERLSRGTGQSHPLGGFTGLAEYEGDLTEFIPYLEIARYTGVGRQTVWGKGEISLDVE
jgi:hypothetical protein